MAALTIVVADINLQTGTHQTAVVTAGTTITPMQTVYSDSADSNEYKLCDASATGTANCDGLAILGSTDGNPMLIIKKGPVDVGATLVLGATYCVSPTAGGIEIKSGVLTGDYLTELGVATGTTTLDLDIKNTQIVMP